MSSAKIPRICENCGDPFKTYAYRLATGRGRFCSRICANEDQIIPKVQRVCLYCNSAFEVPRAETWRPNKQHSGCFCSQPCFHAWARTRVEIKPGTLRPLAERFLRFVGETTDKGCILWTGGAGPDGRGTIWSGAPENRQICAPAAALILAGRPLPRGLFALHRCDNPPCVNPEHLFAGTRADNTRDMVSKGRHAHGNRHGFAKITEAIVIAARQRYAEGGVTYRDLAREYGNISPSALGQAISGISWRHVPMLSK